ncbi:MAG TPA: hybrid sensor histidine kinase/response regulator [Tepidisphaeraceae bacterium]|nr:hybrid sensor histidine kinase/response regulator [Tepidisphaeraceae bacterium]
MPRRHSILIVDDEPDVVRSVKDLLRLDYKVFGATSAAEGMQILEENVIDVVMTDQRMPEMTGVEFLSHVRDPHPDATRLLFTGYADIGAVIDAINQGNVYRYIAKPWDPDELQTIIREACERHDLLVQRKQLLRELEEKNAELQRANAELLAANELKAAFIQVASHELRTPLAIAQGFSELCVRQKDIASPLRDWLDRVHRALRRLGYLVNQIIAMLEAGQFEQRLNPRPVELASVIREAVEDVRPFVELRHQQLVDQVPESLGAMSLDADKIRDSVNHLLLNAIKFTPDGGSLTVSAERNGEAVIRVSDTGCGIDANHLPRIGEAFFTGYDVTKHSSGHFEHGRQGVGLGLSVVKAFVELHGGKLEVSSEVGCGSTFTIRLPDAPR